MCAQVCAVSYAILKFLEEPMNCSWLFVEDKYVQDVLTHVR